MSGESITNRIRKLVDDEHRLHKTPNMHDEERAKLKAIEIELDQCWDLLRRRRAKQEFGDNPDDTEVRSPTVVESYKG